MPGKGAKEQSLWILLRMEEGRGIEPLPSFSRPFLPYSPRSPIPRNHCWAVLSIHVDMLRSVSQLQVLFVGRARAG